MFKLNEATHVAMPENESVIYGVDGEMGVFTKMGKYPNVSIDEYPIAFPITDLCPEGYTGDHAEYRLDCLKRDLDAHSKDIQHYEFFQFTKPGVCISYHNYSRGDGWHQMPTTRGTVADNKVTVEKMIERDGYDAGMRHAMQDIAKIVGKKFGVDVGYENLPKVVADKLGVVTDPKSNKWNGEGLPPVGVECEVLCKAYDIGWHKVKVEWLDDVQVLVSEPGELSSLYLLINCKFRPIRTDRENAIEHIKHIMSERGVGSSISGAIVDALGADTILNKLEK